MKSNMDYMCERTLNFFLFFIILKELSNENFKQKFIVVYIAERFDDENIRAQRIKYIYMRKV